MVGNRDELIYQKYCSELTRFATGLVGPSRAGDVVADAVVACMRASGWSAVRNPRAYLYRSVFNEARRSQRREVRRRLRERAAAVPEDIAAHETDQDVWEAVCQLSARQRAVIFLTYWSDLTPESIAGLLHISEGAVRRHLARGRRRLHDRLESYGP